MPIRRDFFTGPRDIIIVVLLDFWTWKGDSCVLQSTGHGMWLML
jgi:hypothetical protein